MQHRVFVFHVSVRNVLLRISFKQKILKFICLGPSKVCNTYNSSGLKFWTRLYLGLSYLHAHKFSHNFSDCLDELCISGTNIDSMNHFLFQYPVYVSEWQTLMEKVYDVEISILDQNKNYLCYTLLFGSEKLNDVKNLYILNATVEYILLTERCNAPFWITEHMFLRSWQRLTCYHYRLHSLGRFQ